VLPTKDGGGSLGIGHVRRPNDSKESFFDVMTGMRRMEERGRSRCVLCQSDLSEANLCNSKQPVSDRHPGLLY
jgi:hypothetical protein